MADPTIELLEEKADYVAERLALMGNPRRLLILCRLAEGEMSVGRIQESLDLSQSALSQHLARLRKLDMVATRRDAQTIYYRLADDQVKAMMGALYDSFCRHARDPEEADSPADAEVAES